MGNGQIVYQDLGSQNGSFVSDQPIAQAQPIALSAGHILQAGSIHFQLVDDPNAVESMKRETAVISNTSKAIEPGDFGSADPSASPFKTRNSGWVKIYIIVITVIGIVAIGALVMTLLQGLIRRRPVIDDEHVVENGLSSSSISCAPDVAGIPCDLFIGKVTTKQCVNPLSNPSGLLFVPSQNP